MQHNSIGLLKISHRVLPCLVALLLVLSLVTMPMKVEATTGVAAIAIGAAGSFTPVGYGIAAVALLIALCGAVITSSADLARESEVVYSSLDPSVQAWMDSTGQKLASGSETVSFVIPQVVINNFNNNYKKDDDNEKNKLSSNLPYVAVGADQLTRLDQLNPLNVMSSDVTGLLAQGVDLLTSLSLALETFQYDADDQYKNMKAGFYDQMIETRVYLGSHIESMKNALYDRISNLANRMETQSVETRQVLQEVLHQTTTDIYDNITLARNQIVVQLVQTRGAVTNSFSGIKSAIDSIAADVGSLAGSKDDTEDQIAIAPPFSVPNLKSKITSIAEGFNDLFQRSDVDEDKDYPWLPFNLFKNKDGSKGFFLDMFDDSEFMNTLKSFYDFVAALWLLFPLAIRYFISFAFGTPIIVGLAKMFAG